MAGKAPDALSELVAIVEPPLRYLATARPKRLGPHALPTERILALIDAVDRGGEVDRGALERLRALFTNFPLDVEAERLRRAAEGLREIEHLRQPRPAAAHPVYSATSSDLAAQLQLLSSPAQFLKGVGPKRAEQLGRFGLAAIEDVLYHLPFRYADRRTLTPIARLVPGPEAT